ncbi:hypothetical protein [Mycolicibacterium conceptionense]|uniref:hypothetical protein n=1 Tax=Mycolicibacterium conceptionense TaxID=451644 RepID=UPI000970168F|nr:hypothetical protein [Mycolicibacterium conceptionense]OMB79223.1 hypothetical protein A5743_14040 [Mycolicibacterium conceptionense]
MTEKHTLPELIELASAKHDGASGRRLADIAAAAGYDVSHTTLNRIRSGTYNGDPTATTIRAIAWLANVPEDKAFDAAGQDAPRAPFASVLPPGVDNLGPSERRAVVELLRVFTQYHQRDWERAQREWNRISELAGNVATALRTTGELVDWLDPFVPEDHRETFEEMVYESVAPLFRVANWYRDHASELADERNASRVARSQLNELYDAVAAMQHFQKGTQHADNTVENAPQSDASPETQQDQEAGAGEVADEESARPAGDHHPPGSRAQPSAKSRRRDASQIQDRIPRPAKSGKRGKNATGFDQ